MILVNRFIKATAKIMSKGEYVIKVNEMFIWVDTEQFGDYQKTKDF